MRELYVYYRVREGDAASAREAVLEMQAGLRDAQPGLTARLLVRPVASDKSTNWMEIYARPGAAEGVGPDVEALIESRATAWARFVDGPRHVEAFFAADR